MTDNDIREFLAENDKKYEVAVSGWSHIYDAAVDDLKFVYDIDDGQWDGNIRAEREAASRPVLTINKLLKFVRQIRTETLINRPRIQVIPVDSYADVQIAGLYNDIIRQIEYHSSADIAYDTAFMHSVSCSIGYFRIMTKYANDMSFDQNIYIARVPNPFSIRFDPGATDFNMEDAQYCFIEKTMTEKEFKSNYPDADYRGFSGDNTGQEYAGWFVTDSIRVVECFEKVPVKRKIALLTNGQVVELTKEKPVEYYTAMGEQIAKERVVNTHKIIWFKRSGSEILEGISDWAGKYIPVIPVFGDELMVEGRKHYLSAIRGAKGIQQMYNAWATAGTENVSLSPKTHIFVDSRQIEGFEHEWDEAHLASRPYLRYRTIPGVPKPQKEPQVQVPGAVVSMMQLTGFDIEDHLGRYEASKGAPSNERSGIAIQARISQADKGSFAFVDNLSRAIVYAGRQLIDLIPKIYDTHRALRIRGEDDQESLVDVNLPVINEMGNINIVNNLAVGEYDLIAKRGMSFSSKRQEAHAFMVETMQYAPALAPIIAPLIFKYADWPGAQEIYEELKREIEKQVQAQQAAQTPQQMSPIPNVMPQGIDTGVVPQ